MDHPNRFDNRWWLTLAPLARHENATLLLLRLGVGAFLVWGVADNLLSSARMAEFEAFLAQHGFPLPALMAPISVWVQCVVGLAFILGLFTRWAGLLCSLNFVVAIIMVDAQNGIRAAFPATCLVLIGLYLATRGAGAYGLDRFVERPASSSSATQ